MKVQQKLVVPFFALLLLASASIDARASCPIGDVGPPCQEFWEKNTVFIGVATRVVSTPNNTGVALGPYLHSTVHFSIEEAFKGIDGTTVVFDLSSCAYGFKQGERYLVYAQRNSDNTFYVDERSTRTRPLSEAAEDLKYIRAVSSEEPGTRVFGKVQQYFPDFPKGGWIPHAIPNIKVTLEGNGQRQEVVSDSDGNFEFKRVSAGTYRARPELPSYLRYREMAHKLTGRGCMEAEFVIVRKAQLFGRVLNTDGKPLAGIPVSVVPADVSAGQIFSEDKDKAAWPVSITDQEGRYWFDKVGNGRFLLIINRTEAERLRGSARSLSRLFYPGVSSIEGATVVVVRYSPEPEEFNFRLPAP